MTPVSFELGNLRLLELADLLESIPEVHPEGNELRGYDQKEIIHPCGSPACAWGHWLFSNKARTERIFTEAHSVGLVGHTYGEKGEKKFEFVYTDQAQHEFGISDRVEFMLFNRMGCGGAKTGAQAASFIREFVERRRNNQRLAS